MWRRVVTFILPAPFLKFTRFCRSFTIQPDVAHSVGEERFLAFGASEQGRMLVVVFTERGDAIRIIGAREMTPRERRDYEVHD